MEQLPATTFEFILPRGFVDVQGGVHRRGVMRLATARDEIVLQKDPRSLENATYGTLILLSQVIIHLGTLPHITPEMLENLFTLDLAYLREFYNRINQQESLSIPTQCPQCNHGFQVEMALAGES